MSTFYVDVTLTYEVKTPSTIILNIEPLEIGEQKIIDDKLQTSRAGNRKALFSVYPFKKQHVLTVDDLGPLTVSYQASVTTEMAVIPRDKLVDVPICDLPASILSYLHPSRYCQSDKLYTFAIRQFGHLDTPYEKVMAIRDWIFSKVEYRAGYSNPQTSAIDTLIEQVGVCRDFSHVGVALCRALDLPARYLSAYAYQLDPPDFHACFEVYLGGYWIVVDATRLAPLNGLIRISSGLDASETAIASVFGHTVLTQVSVAVEMEKNEVFKAVDANSELVGYAMHTST